jgi:hypothetical protein
LTAIEIKAPTKVRYSPLTRLIAMVVGSMVGAGIFPLPRNFAQATGAYGALVAWAIAGTGMLMPAFSPIELVIFVIAVAGFSSVIAALATGAITI